MDYSVKSPLKGKLFWLKGYPIILVGERKYIIPFEAIQDPKRGSFIKIVKDCTLTDYEYYMQALSAAKEQWVKELEVHHIRQSVAEKLFPHRHLIKPKDWAEIYYDDIETLSRWANARSKEHVWDCRLSYHWKVVAKASRIMCYAKYGRVLKVPALKEWEYWAIQKGAGVVRN